MKVLADTSLLVAAMVEPHPKHEQAFPWLRQAKSGELQLVVTTHTLAELYALLTTLPLSPRISPDAARRLIRSDVESIATIVDIRRGDYVRVLNSMSELMLSGGCIYDALAARIAEKAGVDKLLTFNTSDFKRVWPDGHAIICEP